MSRVFISPLATPFHSLVSIFPIPSRYISIFRAPPPRYFSPSLNLPADIRQALAALPPAAAAPAPAAGNSLDDAERAALLAALDGQRWHVSRVAEQLGISRNTLYRKLRRHGLVRGQA